MKTAFDALAQSYDMRIAGAARQWTVESTIDSLQSISRITGRVCELGCGTGLYSRAIANAGCVVCAVDFSFPMLAAAKRSGTGRLVCADCSKPLPFEDATFDVVASFDALTYVADLDFVFRESKRILKRGGWFFAVVPNALSVVRALARSARLGGYAAGGPEERHGFRKKNLRKQIEAIFGPGGVRVIRPVPGFASGVFTQAPSALRPLFFSQWIGLGLLAWGRKT